MRRSGRTDGATLTKIALARAVRTQEGTEQTRILGLIRPFLADANPNVAEAAILALGVVGHFTAAAPLVELLEDTEVGRRLIGRGEVPYRSRAFAAYALGLTGARTSNEDVRRYAVHNLAAAVRDDQGRWKDLGVACVLGIGMIPLTDRNEDPAESDGTLPPSASRVGQLRFLQGLFENTFEDKLTRAHAADAVGRLFTSLSAPRREHLKPWIAAPFLAAIGRGGEGTRETLESAVVALGSIGDDDEDPTDRAIRKALIRLEDLHRDREARNLALLSLARTAARPGIGESPGGGLATVQRQLRTQFTHGQTAVRPWAVLSMGVLARGLAVRGIDPPSGFAEVMRAALLSTDSPGESGAYCIAAGLLGDPRTADHIRRHLVKTKNDAVRIYAAMGLALLPAPASAEDIDKLLVEASHRPALVESLAVAKALLDDREAVHEIAEHLANAQSLDGKKAFLYALGRIGDVRAIDPLATMVARPTVPAEVRAAAITALGMVVEPEILPWPSIVATGVNVFAPTETLLSGEETGILDRR